MHCYLAYHWNNGTINIVWNAFKVVLQDRLLPFELQKNSRLEIVHLKWFLFIFRAFPFLVSEITEHQAVSDIFWPYSCSLSSAIPTLQPKPVPHFYTLLPSSAALPQSSPMSLAGLAKFLLLPHPPERSGCYRPEWYCRSGLVGARATSSAKMRSGKAVVPNFEETSLVWEPLKNVRYHQPILTCFCAKLLPCWLLKALCAVSFNLKWRSEMEPYLR